MAYFLQMTSTTRGTKIQRIKFIKYKVLPHIFKNNIVVVLKFNIGVGMQPARKLHQLRESGYATGYHQLFNQFSFEDVK